MYLEKLKLNGQVAVVTGAGQGIGAACARPLGEAGAKVIVALETAFSLEQGQLQNERQILRGFGNMSAPTVLFVLEQGLKEDFSGRRFVSALGPRFTAGFLTMLQ